VNLYALVSCMRVVASSTVVESADSVVRAIIEMYLAPNKTFRDLEQIFDDDKMNPLREFSSACRNELMWLRGFANFREVRS
jgi:hypothetical protein